VVLIINDLKSSGTVCFVVRYKRVFIIRVLAAALLVLVASSQSLLASLSYEDGNVHEVLGSNLGGGLQVGNFSTVEIYEVRGTNCGDVLVSPGSVLDFEGGPRPDGVVISTVVPEPDAIMIWSLLGGLGIAIGCRRHNRAG